MTKEEFLADISGQLPNNDSIVYGGATVTFGDFGDVVIKAWYLETSDDDEDAEQFDCDMCEDTGQITLCDMSVFPYREYREPCGCKRREAE